MSQAGTFNFNDRGKSIKGRHSFYETKSINDSGLTSKSDTFSRSTDNIIKTTDFPSIIDSGRVNRHSSSFMEANSDEYYKNYEHDEVPEKDSYCLSSDLPDSNHASHITKEITNSDIEKLELRIFKNMSKELQTDESTSDTREYNIKIFKTTVIEILEKFYSNVRDFDIDKEKFHYILSKNKDNLVEEMEDIVKEIINNIVSSESCVSSKVKEKNHQPKNMIKEDTFGDDSRTLFLDTDMRKCHISKQNTIEAYNNENYLTDSTFDDETGKINNGDKTCAVYLLKGHPCVEIKMDGRNILSEISIRNRNLEEINQIASADNVKRITAKRLQMTKYMKQAEHQTSDKIIPVKFSYAKKNIHSEDGPNELDENKSFLNKICNFLCKKLRKTSLA